MATPLRVLILEDSPADEELMVHELRRSGFDSTCQRVETEADYQAGLESEWDVILADYNLPQWDALWALKRLQERGLDIPFIVVSGLLGDELAAECLKQGAADYLLKGRLARLGPAVVHALEQKRLRIEKRQMEEQIRLLNVVMESAANAVVITDREGRISWVNPAFSRMTGYSQ